MDIKALYQCFRAWQLEPFKFEIKSDKTHHCYNCGNQFVGNYCPVCGQSYSEGPVAGFPEPQEKEHKPLFGLLERGSVVSFILQLLGRPGYMMSDYLKGRKQVCAAPFKMLCYVVIVTVVALRLTGKGGIEWALAADGNMGLMGICLQWMSDNLDWAVLIQTMFLILPVWMLFGCAPKYPHHKLSEGLNIQMFMASLVLLCIALRVLIADWLIILVLIYNYVAYRQLFGYSVWGTLWRTVLSIGIVFFIFAVPITTVRFLQSGELPQNYTTGSVIAMACGLFLAGIGVLFAGRWIDRKTAAKE